MGELLDGLTQAAEDMPAVSGSAKEKRKGKGVVEHVCTLVDVEQMAKVRCIAEREGVSIKDIFAAALTMAISSYEKKNGPIKVKASKKGDVREIFG